MKSLEKRIAEVIQDRERIEEKLLNEYEEEIRNPTSTITGRDNGINVNMVNTVPYGWINVPPIDSIGDPDEYLSCLTVGDFFLFCS